MPRRLTVLSLTVLAAACGSSTSPYVERDAGRSKVSWRDLAVGLLGTLDVAARYRLAHLTRAEGDEGAPEARRKGPGCRNERQPLDCSSD